jgi:hypothetical protein
MTTDFVIPLRQFIPQTGDQDAARVFSDNEAAFYYAPLQGILVKAKATQVRCFDLVPFANREIMRMTAVG